MADQRIDLTIEGMTCDHCVRAVRGRLEKTDGVAVERVVVGSATVRIDPAHVTLDDLQDAVSDEGYTAYVNEA